VRRIRKRLQHEIDKPQLPADHRPSHFRQGKRALQKTTGIRVVVIPEDARISDDKPVTNQANLGLREPR
jgi:hypothetical protein